MGAVEIVPCTPVLRGEFAALLAIEVGGARAYQRGIHVLEGVDADDGVQAIVNEARDDRDHAATATDIELRGLAAELIFAKQGRLGDRDF